ncbi:peroxynitrite isomerase THAP4 isoform X1 [Hyalella azteca]|uniref:Peroxynitrite isomerase THAP4 isoform X1 n=1 Tax=Hyalella azteca TaxID=294128 RepID=A0A8B7NBG8_HYAAZ|nr:peroxynitrite isomerase THAP4 isoform X1 [Hyalella azteca]
MKTCSASGCVTTHNSPVSLHQFPKDPVRRQEWANATGRYKFVPTKFSYLCARHFKEEDIDRSSSSKIRLRPGATPSIFGPVLPHHKAGGGKPMRMRRRDHIPENACGDIGTLSREQPRNQECGEVVQIKRTFQQKLALNGNIIFDPVLPLSKVDSGISKKRQTESIQESDANGSLEASKIPKCEKEIVTSGEYLPAAKPSFDQSLSLSSKKVKLEGNVLKRAKQDYEMKHLSQKQPAQTKLKVKFLQKRPAQFKSKSFHQKQRSLAQSPQEMLAQSGSKAKPSKKREQPTKVGNHKILPQERPTESKNTVTPLHSQAAPSLLQSNDKCPDNLDDFCLQIEILKKKACLSEQSLQMLQNCSWGLSEMFKLQAANISVPDLA